MSRPSFGQAFTAGTVSTIVARAQANYYRTLIDEGLSPEQAERMTTETFRALLEGGEGVVKASAAILAQIPGILSEIVQLFETTAVEKITDALKDQPR